MHNKTGEAESIKKRKDTAHKKQIKMKWKRNEK